MKPPTRTPRHTRTRSQTRTRIGSRIVPIVGIGLLLVAVCGAWAAFLAPGCSTVESTSDALADATEGSPLSGIFRGTARLAESYRDYDPSEEHYIGRGVAAQILARYKVHPDQDLRNYVNLVGLAVLAAPEAARTLTGYHFIVLDSEEVQAISAPGGFVCVTAGAVRKAKDEDELAALLAHEIAHVSLKHGIQAVKAATRKRAAGLLAKGAGETAGAVTEGRTQELVELTSVFGDVVQEITTELIVKGYSRDMELAADAAAAQYLRSSGYARSALVRYLRTLDREGMGGEGGWRTTHPPAGERARALVSAGVEAEGSTPGHDVRKARFEETAGRG